MQRILMNHMPLHSENGEQIGKLHGYKLRDMASHLTFYQPSLRYPGRIDTIKSNVLVALCGHYPNVWPGVPALAKEAHCSVAQAHRALRELELEDKLIVDVNSHYSWRLPTEKEISNGHPAHKRILQCDDRGKSGGGKNDTVQYVIHDRKIYDLYQQQKAWEKRERAQKKLDRKAKFLPQEPLSGEAINPSQGSVNESASTPLRGAELPLSGEQVSGTPTPFLGTATPLPGEATPLPGEPKQGIPLFREETNQPFLTENKNLPPPTHAKDLGRRLEAVFSSAGLRTKLSLAGLKNLLALSATDDEIVGTFDFWLKHRNIDGLNHPLTVFSAEFDVNLAELRTQQQRQAEKASQAKRMEEAKALAEAWRQTFIAAQSTFTYHESGTDLWVVDVTEWLQTNRPLSELAQFHLVEWAENEIKLAAQRRGDDSCYCAQCWPNAPEHSQSNLSPQSVEKISH